MRVVYSWKFSKGILCIWNVADQIFLVPTLEKLLGVDVLSFFKRCSRAFVDTMIDSYLWWFWSSWFQDSYFEARKIICFVKWTCWIIHYYASTHHIGHSHVFPVPPVWTLKSCKVMWIAFATILHESQLSLITFKISRIALQSMHGFLLVSL